ncbi:MAG: hypothetical protein A2W75_02765 [Nitrospinae bacterium RIFCSPLOWO2_12_39_15]|nr:MAG: hypothetical protein A2W75_02765 [Nitrospinae bacterium RIFCSPLOWO2_12_39_15]
MEGFRLTTPTNTKISVTAPRGFEGGVEKEDLIIPRAKLLQAMSPEMQEGGFTVGEIINSLTKEYLAEEFIPIFMFKNWIRFNPRSKTEPNFNSEYEAGAIIWKSNDPRDPLVLSESKFGAKGEKPLAITFMNFFSVFAGSQTPVIVSFCKSSYHAGQELLSLARFSGGDMFSKKYKLSSKDETKDGSVYKVYGVKAAGKVTEEEYAKCENLWKEFSYKRIEVHDIEDSEKAPF